MSPVVEPDADDLAGAEHRRRVSHAVRGHAGRRGGGQLAELFGRVGAAGVQIAHVAQPGQVGPTGTGRELVHRGEPAVNGDVQAGVPRVSPVQCGQPHRQLLSEGLFCSAKSTVDYNVQVRR